MAFNRTDLVGPWWGAWAPVILAIVAGLVVAGLMLAGVFADGVCLPAWLVGFFADRDLTLRGSWRLARRGVDARALLIAAEIILSS